MLPDNDSYYHAAYAAATAIYIAYALLLTVRRNRVRERNAARVAG